VLWVAQGKYLMECANDTNKGIFFGIFWVFQQGSIIFGSTLVAYFLDDISESFLYMFLTGVAFVCVFYFSLFLRKPTI